MNELIGHSPEELSALSESTMAEKLCICLQQLGIDGLTPDSSIIDSLTRGDLDLIELRNITGSDKAAIAVFNYLNEAQGDGLTSPAAQSSQSCNHWERKNEVARGKYPYAARGPGRYSSDTSLCKRPTLRSSRLKRRKFRIFSRSE